MIEIEKHESIVDGIHKETDYKISLRITNDYTRFSFVVDEEEAQELLEKLTEKLK